MSFWTNIKSSCAALSPNCQQASRAQSDALDAPLPFSKRLGLWLHLVICKWCRRYGKQIRFLRSAAHEHADPLTQAVPENLSPEARERVKQALQHAQDNSSS